MSAILRHPIRYFLLLLLLLIGFGLYHLPSLYFKTSNVPQADYLNHDELDLYSKILETEMDGVDTLFMNLKKRDSSVYHTLFVSDSISSSSLNSNNNLLLTPKNNQENEELRLYYEVLENEMEKAEVILELLKKKDEEAYRLIFEAEPAPDSIHKVDTNSTNRYRN